MRQLALAMLVCVACNTKATADRTTASTATAASAAEPAVFSAPASIAALEAPPPASAASPTASSSSEVVVSEHPLTRYKTVVHVGDSMVGYHMGLQLELGKMWKGIGVHYEALTVTAAGIHSFAGDKHVAKLVKAKDPDLVIVQIGTNNLTVPHPEAYLDDLKSIVGQIGDRACVWIGPIPLEQPEHGMRSVLRDNVAPCVFYDSWDLDLARQTDKIHPTQAASKKWANALWEFAKENAPAPHSR